MRLASLTSFLLSLAATAQLNTAPPLPPEERIDLTMDGVPDMVLFGRTYNVYDPGQGHITFQRRWVQFLPGTTILIAGPRGHSRYYELADSEQLSVPALAERFHFKQMEWSAPTDTVRFMVLSRDVRNDQPDGWHTEDAFEERTLVLRSTAGRSPKVAAFTIAFDITTGHIGVTSRDIAPVPIGFGDEPRVPPQQKRQEEEYSFGHEREPQVIIPPGLPPDEHIDLVGDEAPDVILTAREEHWHGTGNPGYYVRGISPAPGMAFLMHRQASVHPWEFFRLPYGAELTPEALAAGIAADTLRWGLHPSQTAFCRVLQHPFGMPHLPQEWSLVTEEWPGDLVYRTLYYGRATIIGIIEIGAQTPGGELTVRGQNWVEEGKVLGVR